MKMWLWDPWEPELGPCRQIQFYFKATCSPRQGKRKGEQQAPAASVINENLTVKKLFASSKDYTAASQLYFIF